MLIDVSGFSKDLFLLGSIFKVFVEAVAFLFPWQSGI